MPTYAWFLLVGFMLLFMGFSSRLIKRIPVTSAMLYLLVGIVAGPSCFALFHFNPLKESALLEILTEVAVLISLFAAGVKMPVPFRWRMWSTPISLAFVGMTCSVLLVTGYGVTFLGLPLGAAVLMGAVLAPTDPVLATDIQSRRQGDEDSLRFSLTSEAGMNDGSAFPFVMLGLGLLGLHELGAGGWRWVAIDVIWATVAGVGIGIIGGAGLARWSHHLRQGANGKSGLLDDFLGLGLIAFVYGVSLLLHAWGFLAVFAAAVALRQTELKLTHAKAESIGLQDEFFQRNIGQNEKMPSKPAPQLSEAALVFKEHLERLSELILILLVGGMLFWDSWSWQAVIFALVLFLFIRPASVFVATLFAKEKPGVTGLMSWFGVRGIGSLYYLMYAIQHGLPEPLAVQLIHFTLIVVVLSILLHGISVKPLMWRYARGNLKGQGQPGTRKSRQE